MPADPTAAAALAAWCETTDTDTTLDASQLDLSGVDLSGADLALATLFDTNLTDAKLVEADLYRAQSADAVLDNADLTGASLVKACLGDTRLRGAVLARADLRSADLWNVDARAASFRHATLDGAAFGDVSLLGADLTGASAHDATLDVELDDSTVVTGLSGEIRGPARLSEGDAIRELAGLELESWLNSRGASVTVLNSPPGTVTYYARVDDEFPRERPAGIVRRRRDGTTFRDEAFTRHLRWEPTEYLRRYELGHNDDDHIEITEEETARFITRIRAEQRDK
ncbi:pentapeptide repeat-containing protein [Streptomyces sp. NBC_01016]|uniref:pentapeptide repeat-containing protein n=1 Tax=Streptomyces sp. NBC_01016 TaxID=2903720 RepID=UPI002252C924|nr:pentapeptide repeat-containing protein [Streptomyces sp. NBC_01016]MCX4834898.1 pentapeptide repeat-containing protein [Streptomyces sp. NBC_01016]